MFESVKRIYDRPTGLRCFVSFLVSMIVHGTIVCAIVFVPLVFCNVVPLDSVFAWVGTELIVPKPPQPPTPPSGRVPERVQQKSTEEYVISKPGKELSIDPVGPLPPVGKEEFDPRAGFGPNWMGPSIGVGEDTMIATKLPTIIKAHDLPPLPPPIKRPLMISVLQPSKLIRRVDPVYPLIAIKTHTEGTVRLKAIIDEDGNVTEPIEVLSGHPFLVRAALEAVKHWKYSPTIVSGEPMSVTGIIEVTFIIRK
jgi:protein TonB